MLDRILNYVLGPNRMVARRDDPDFGQMRFNGHGIWCSEVLFPPTGTMMNVYLHQASKAGPTPWQRQRFHELLQRFNSLRQDMQIRVTAEYEQTRKDWNLKSIQIDDPSEIWKVASLRWIVIYAEGFWADMELDHQLDWDDDDHFLTVCIKDWRVVEVKVEG